MPIGAAAEVIEIEAAPAEDLANLNTGALNRLSIRIRVDRKGYRRESGLEIQPLNIRLAGAEGEAGTDKDRSAPHSYE